MAQEPIGSRYGVLAHTIAERVRDAYDTVVTSIAR
jgi:hypothetical protein